MPEVVRTDDAPLVFISHITEEARLAVLIRQWLRTGLGGDVAFISSEDISAGEQWMSRVDDALVRAAAVVVLCSPRSSDRPWLLFEAGAGHGRAIPVLPVCHSGMTMHQLSQQGPLAIFQGLELTSPAACVDLVERAASLLDRPSRSGLDPDLMLREMQDAARASTRANPSGAAPLDPPPEDRAGVLVDVSHGQAEWPLDRAAPSVFDPDRLLPLLAGAAPEWVLQPLSDARHFWLPDLEPWRAVVLALPRRRPMEVEAVAELVQWVRAGGRLLLLGYELGDRHHGGNLNVVAHEFGLHFQADIVAPTGSGGGKPYGLPVSLSVDAPEHPVLAHVRMLRWLNVQTVTVEPGGRGLVGLGDNSLTRPDPDAVLYTEGTMGVPGARYETTAPPADAFAVAEAPQGLCGRGRVLAIGTWDLAPSRTAAEEQDNAVFVRNLLDWAAGLA